MLELKWVNFHSRWVMWLLTPVRIYSSCIDTAAVKMVCDQILSQAHWVTNHWSEIRCAERSRLTKRKAFEQGCLCCNSIDPVREQIDGFVLTVFAACTATVHPRGRPPRGHSLSTDTVSHCVCLSNWGTSLPKSFVTQLTLEACKEVWQNLGTIMIIFVR